MARSKQPTRSTAAVDARGETVINLGRATLKPRRPVVAGSHATVTYTYTAGHPVDDSGYVMVAFRHVSDFGTPQFDRPGEVNYCSVRTTGDCRILPRWDAKGHTRPWSAALLLQVRGGFLACGEKIILTFGDTSDGSPGWRVQTFAERAWTFRTLVDPIATYQFKRLNDSPALAVVAGEPVRAVCLAPSQVTAGEPFEILLKLEDRWGNPVGRPSRRKHRPFADTGVQTVTARDKRTGLEATSPPLEVRPAGTKGLKRWWADFHGQSEETIGSNTIDDYFTFARDWAALDIAAHQGNDFQITDAFWRTVNRTTRHFYRPGSFITFPGYEWSGNTPLGGDRNVYFVREGGPIHRSCRDLVPGHDSVYPDAPTAADLFKRLRDADGPEAYVFAHVGGRYADLAMHDGAVEGAVEVHSAWGTFEWLVDDVLRRGYRVGICANSDGHKGRPGASYPGAGDFGSYGGLTCVLAAALDRRRIWTAMKARHFYATTGHRPLVDLRVRAADGREAIMGDVLDDAGERVTLDLDITGTGAIERVDVRNGADLVRTLRPYASKDLGRRIKLTWSGAEVRGRGRMTTWDGDLRLDDTRIEALQSVNLWNPDRPLETLGDRHVCWRSATTGGAAGMILTLTTADRGRLDIRTAQGRARCALGPLRLKGRTWDFGGLDRRISLLRLPDPPSPSHFRARVTVPICGSGDNALYVRILQEDGHVSWTSPVYVRRGPSVSARPLWQG